MKYVIAVVALLLSFMASAQEGVEVSLGATRMTPQDNGVWYQEGFPYTLKMTSPSASIGFKWIAKDGLGPIDRVYLRAGYEYIGRASSSAVATASDQNYAECQYDHSKCWRLSHWYGKGYAHGVYISAVPEKDVGGVGLFVESGVYLYQPRWDMQIPDWIGTADDTPHMMHVVHKSRLQGAWLFGFGVRQGTWAVAYTRRHLDCHGDPWSAIYNGPAHNVQVRFTF